MWPRQEGARGMLRVAMSVIVGYLVMAMLVMSTMFVAAQVMDLDSMFEPGLWQATPKWNAVAVMISLLSAIAGGAVCERIAAHPMGSRLLALVFLVAMIGAGVTVLSGKEQPPPDARPTMEQLAEHAKEKGMSTKMFALWEGTRHTREPRWMVVANPACGLVGALAGAALARRQRLAR